MYRYFKGSGQIWVDSEPPPENSTNVLWLRFPKEGPSTDMKYIRFEVDPATGILYMITSSSEPGVDGSPATDEEALIGFELLAFAVNAGSNQGQWIPIQGTRGRRGPSGVVVQDTEPDDPEIKIWVDTSEGNENVLVVENDMNGESNNPVTKTAIKAYIADSIDELLEQLAEQSGQIVL